MRRGGSRSRHASVFAVNLDEASKSKHTYVQMLLRLRAAARRVHVTAPSVPSRLLGSHAHAHADDHHHDDPKLSPAAKEYQATHATLFGEVCLLFGTLFHSVGTTVNHCAAHCAG